MVEKDRGSGIIIKHERASWDPGQSLGSEQVTAQDPQSKVIRKMNCGHGSSS